MEARIIMCFSLSTKRRNRTTDYGRKWMATSASSRSSLHRDVTSLIDARELFHLACSSPSRSRRTCLYHSIECRDICRAVKDLETRNIDRQPTERRLTSALSSACDVLIQSALPLSPRARAHAGMFSFTAEVRSMVIVARREKRSCLACLSSATNNTLAGGDREPHLICRRRRRRAISSSSSGQKGDSCEFG